MKILFTGKSKLDYNRVRVIKAGLQQISGVEVLELKLNKNDKKNIEELKQKSKQADYIYIPPMRHSDVSYVKKHTTQPIVFDPLISKYLTKADYGHFWKLPFKYFLDKVPFEKADLLLTDTNAHREYFINKFNLKPKKVKTLYIGADTQLFFKQKEHRENNGKFIVGFYGSFIPLQGTEKIVRSAQCLKNHTDIQFEMIGSGYTLKNSKKIAEKEKLNNINFRKKVKYEELSPLINSFDISLGIFGDSKKTDLVIPNKVYHYAAIEKCILTKNTAGIKEIFTNDEDISLASNDPQAMADKILELKENTEQRNKLGKQAGKLLHTSYNEVEVARKFLNTLSSFKN